MKVILDTNVVVSGTFWTGSSFKILNLIDQEKLIFVVSGSAKANYIISNDKHLLKLKEFNGIKIIKPEEFLLKYKSTFRVEGRIPSLI